MAPTFPRVLRRFVNRSRCPNQTRHSAAILPGSKAHVGKDIGGGLPEFVASIGLAAHAKLLKAARPIRRIAGHMELRGWSYAELFTGS